MMTDNLKGKSAPWDQIQACLSVLDKQHASINGLITLMNDGTLEEKDLETKTIKPLFIIFEAIAKLLRDNKIIKSESEEEKVKIEAVTRAIMKLQTSFITQNNIMHVKQEIEKTIGPAISQEIENLLLSMSGLLE